MTKSKYKRRIESQLKKAVKHHEKYVAVFFDESKTLKRRMYAFDRIGTFKGASEIEKATNIYRDTSQPDEIREAALR